LVQNKGGPQVICRPDKVKTGKKESKEWGTQVRKQQARHPYQGDNRGLRLGGKNKVKPKKPEVLWLCNDKRIPAR